ncbi:hypothetical protein [Rhabdochromatium marinum]|uniref:hypothetical protein n=1 Tax=Rhabdochromatium marinum TaxID=48729 RepID=UPI00190593C4|nr:hypothetical protein [Rhabdochromatium marinum]MBK1650311.1 hypothetical protein [Rhabdochromatium marinum]
MSYRVLVETVLGKPRTERLWTANAYSLLPITPQSLDIGGVFPALLYAFRWGHRRGKGQFEKIFGQSATIAGVTEVLLNGETTDFCGFDGETGAAILGDLLLAFCLENKKHALGQHIPVLRVYPTHYMASWIDLPKEASNLRRVPEFLCSLLTHDDIEDLSMLHFPLAQGFISNPLLATFGRSMRIRGQHSSDVHSDWFQEETAEDLGIDELLTIRLAQRCKTPPDKARKNQKNPEGSEIPQQTAVASRAAEILREDLAVFIRGYGGIIPRQAFLQMLESCVCLGLTHLLFSTLAVLNHWKHHGRIPDMPAQGTLPLFLDCSQGQDKDLRGLSEQVMQENQQQYETLPLLMMVLRVLEDYATTDRKLRDEASQLQANQSAFLTFLTDLLREEHPQSYRLLDTIDEHCVDLAETLEKDDDQPTLVTHLRNTNLHPALRLAEALVELMGDTQQRANYNKVLEGALMSDAPNGLAIKRRASQTRHGRRRMMDVRAIVPTIPMLDFLVHRHLKTDDAQQDRTLSLPAFIDILRQRYGLYIADAPPHHAVAQELLLRNKAWLERTLRDMGLLVGVNDAESMKRLKPKYRKEVA